MIFAAIHRWYARQTGLWATVFYLYLCVWAYYTVRATTFHVASLVVWRLLPSILVLAPMALVLGRLRERPAALTPAPAVKATGATSWMVALGRPVGDLPFRGSSSVQWWNAARSRSVVDGARYLGGMWSRPGLKSTRRGREDA